MGSRSRISEIKYDIFSTGKIIIKNRCYKLKLLKKKKKKKKGKKKRSPTKQPSWLVQYMIS